MIIMSDFMFLVTYEEYMPAPQRWDAGPADKPDPGWTEIKYVQCATMERVNNVMKLHKNRNPKRYDCFKR
jgi:hypothetical protein